MTEIFIEQKLYLKIEYFGGHYTEEDNTIYPFSIMVSDNNISIHWIENTPEHKNQIELNIVKQFQQK